MDEIERAFQKNVPEVPATVAANIRAQILRDTSAVRPMPPISRHALFFGGVFALLAVVWGATTGFRGFWVLSPAAALALISSLVVLAIWCGVSAARSMRPGAGNLYSWISTAMVLVVYEALVLVLFDDYSMQRFIHHGMACLTLGLACAATTAVPMLFIARRGFVVDPTRAGAVIGLMSGLTGLMALTLRCPLISVPHTGVWHAAVVPVCAIAGALIGRFTRVFQRS